MKPKETANGGLIQDTTSIDAIQHLPVPAWRLFVLASWLQRRIKEMLARWHLLMITRGRGMRWRLVYRRLLQAAAALLLAGGMLLSPLAPAMPTYAGAAFTEQTGTANPFNGVDVGATSTPVFVDVDGDGDMDAFVGEYYGTHMYFQNTGTALAPAFNYQVGTSDPFNGVEVGDYSTPTFVDIDGDGDMDAFIGEEYGTIKYYKNTGTAIAAAFSQQSGTNNPFDGIIVAVWSAPTFVDIDGDGDMDAFIGGFYGSLKYYRNTGTALAPAFSEQTGTANPMNGVDVGYNSTPTFVDIDGDGDMDAFIGERYGTLKYYQNTGTAITPAFSGQSGAGNPFNGVDVGWLNTPTFVDIDGDGDMDALIGEGDGIVNYYKNTGVNTALRAFYQKTGTDNPLNSVDVGYRSAPTFVDIDGDGDLDAFSGESYGAIKYYKNTGTALAPAFNEQTGTANPFDGVDVSEISAPKFVDIDHDGDMDAFIGEWFGSIKYYKNIGTALAPTFNVQTGTDNPFNSVDVGSRANLDFVDIDGDGDMDTFIGEYLGTLKYYKNSGTALAPAFSQQVGTGNPFTSVDVGRYSAPTFVDIDGDGDMDAFIGEKYGTTKHYKNNGTALAPSFIEQTGAGNPFNGVAVGWSSNPAFVDIDKDGDMDAFIGEQFGTIFYYKATRLEVKNKIPLILR